MQITAPSFWENYQWLIILLVALIIVLSVILVLLIQRSNRLNDDEELRLSEEKFRKAFQANPEAFEITRLADGAILEINDRWEKLLGYPRTEAKGRTTVDLGVYVKQEDRDTFLELFNKDGYVHDFETEVRNKSGQVYFVTATAESLTINGERCALVVVRDVTKRKRAEERLALLQTITVDVAAAKDLTAALEVVLRRVCENTGWAYGQAWLPRIDKTFLDCGPVYVCDDFDAVTFRSASSNICFLPGVGLPGRVWATKQPAWIIDVTLDPNFPRAAIAAEVGLKGALGIPILSGDEVIAILEFFLREPRQEDERLVRVIAAVAAQLGIVIERKMAEAELAETRAGLAHAGRLTAMGELAASIAHEVNQPLTAIVGNSEVCLSWLSRDSPDLTQLREALTDIHDDGNRASEVIKRIRALVRKGPPQKTPLNINDVVAEVAALVNHAAATRRIRMESRLGENLPPVLGDRVQLQQVLLNLMMNGIDAMSAIEVGDRELVAETTQDGNQLRVAVSDCGTGIESKDVEKIFGAFYTTKTDGMGMGLAISRSIIEAHGGKLWASSNNGRGATFQFTLPAHTVETV